MKLYFRPVIATALFFAALIAVSAVFAAGGPTPIGNFGPTGIEISILPDQTLKVLKVQKGSPADGKISKGEIIIEINGRTPVSEDKAAEQVFGEFKQLASFITKAEATDGMLRFQIKPGEDGEAREAAVKIPALGAYSETWPLDCEKTAKIIRANADYIASVAGETGEGLTQHNLYNGFAILMLLSTGNEKDLDVVRKIYATRMAEFTTDEIGSHNWHNGIQGIAVCEYYLRTGDESVMPLINAICESIRKYQVHGGWSHWAKGINPQYTAGGLMNAAGIQNLTTLLLAEQCGADVDPKALDAALRFFYRFVGHANVPYGDHRPEGGFGSNNGKTEMLALAMNVAAQAENGEVYAMARDKSAHTALYDYHAILRGHTGGNGAKWHGIAAALMAEKKPDLYRNQLENKKWFFELSRRYNGAMGACGTGRYDKESYGYATGLTLTAPRKTLQITGAPAAPYARSFRLPARPWGRRADLKFFNIDGGPAYRGPKDAPHIERNKIAEAGKRALRRFASHPEHAHREDVANAIREKELYGLIEELLASDDPLARHTACMAINDFQPWRLRFAKGTRSQASIDPEHFTPAMFESLMDIISDPTSALWSVDQALAAVAVASPKQVKSRLDDIVPWLEHPEWLLNESATLALTPAMKDEEALDIILPTLIDSMATSVHVKGRGVMGWALKNATADAAEKIRDRVARAHAEIFERLVAVEDPEPGVDLSGITSVGLEQQLGGILRDEKWHIRDDPEAILKGARLCVERIDEFRGRELNRVIALLIKASDQLEDAEKKKLGAILVKHFRPLVVGDDPAALMEKMKAGKGRNQMNKLLAIDRMAGLPGGWQLLGSTPAGKQTWWHTSFEPESKPRKEEKNRYRQIDLPDHLTGWYKPEYDPAKHDWTREQEMTVYGVTPKAYGVSREWFAKYLPEAGEVVFVRKTFEIDDLDFEMMRLTVYSRQGYDVYLNGHKIVNNSARSRNWVGRQRYFNDKMKQHLKVGRNVIAVRSFLQYFRGRGGGVDVFVEKLEKLPSVE